MTDRFAAVLSTAPPQPPPGVDPAAYALALLEDTYEVAASLEFVTAALVLTPDAPPGAADITWPGTPVLTLPYASPDNDAPVRPSASPDNAAPVRPYPSPDGVAPVRRYPSPDGVAPVRPYPSPGGAAPVRPYACADNGAGVRPYGGSVLGRVCAWLGELGAGEAVLLAGDAPDLPGLLAGKLFRALGSAEVAVCQADGGGLVGLAVRLPLPEWQAAALDEAGLDTADAFERLRAAAPRRTAVQATPGWHRIRTAADVARLDPGLEGWEATRALLE